MSEQRETFQAIYDKLYIERDAMLDTIMTKKQLKAFNAVEEQIKLIADTANSIIIRR